MQVLLGTRTSLGTAPPDPTSGGKGQCRTEKRRARTAAPEPHGAGLQGPTSPRASPTPATPGPAAGDSRGRDVGAGPGGDVSETHRGGALQAGPGGWVTERGALSYVLMILDTRDSVLSGKQNSRVRKSEKNRRPQRNSGWTRPAWAGARGPVTAQRGHWPAPGSLTNYPAV